MPYPYPWSGDIEIDPASVPSPVYGTRDANGNVVGLGAGGSVIYANDLVPGIEGMPDVQPPNRAQVIVYGATAWGIAAAIAAARQGVDVIVIEPSYHVGGMVTSNIRTDWRSTTYGHQNSISKEFFQLSALKWGISPMEALFDDELNLPNSAMYEAMADMISANGIRVYTGWRLVEDSSAVLKSLAQDVIGITIENSTDPSKTAVIRCAEVIECTPEGDLMYRAGVSNIIGRESSAQYSESSAGVTVAKYTFNGVSPYVISGDSGSGLLPMIEDTALETAGSADSRSMAFGFRFNVTNNPDKRLPWPQPENPDALTHEFFLRWLANNPTKVLSDIMLLYPMRNEGVGAGYLVYGLNAKLAIGALNAIGRQHDYGTLTYAQRAVRDAEHREHTALLIYKLLTDARVPAAIKNELATFGPLASDAHDSTGWPPSLYRREVRRMVGRRVLTQNHADGSQVMPDPVAWGIYTLDVHYVSLRNVAGTVIAEGNVTNTGVSKPYLVGREVLLPKVSEARRLQVVGTPSATHIGWSSLRIDCTLMSLAEAAGVAAALAVKSGRRSDEVSGVEISAHTGFGKLPKWTMHMPGTSDLTNGQVISVTGGSVLVGGYWGASTTGFGQVGDRTYDDAAATTNSHVMRYVPTFSDGAGIYKIGIHVPVASNNATNARVRIKAADGYYERIIDERNGDMLFATLGVFTFAADGTEFIEFSNSGVTGRCRVDALWYERIGDAPAVTFEGLGANLVTNGGFATDTGWTKGTGWTITGGKAVATGLSPGQSLIQNCGLVSGQTYEVSVTVAGLSGGRLQCVVGGGHIGLALTTNATYKILVTPESDSGNITFAAATGPLTATIDDVTAKLVTFL